MKIYHTLIDVRAPWEFENGHVEGSINIPLDQVQNQLEEIKSMKEPILLCCQSGNRSGVAANYLQSEGVTCENGGGWAQVEMDIQNKLIIIEDK